MKTNAFKWLNLGYAFFELVDAHIVRLLSDYSITFLRWALAVTFIWFGGLKILGVSPVGDLVAQTVPWLPPQFFVPFLGAWEVVIGVGLLVRFGLRITLALFFAQMVGTFLVLVLLPQVSFQNGNPLLLTTTGEFVVKNFVLLSAGLVVGSTVRRPREGIAP
jgi:putative oxidoreductase